MTGQELFKQTATYLKSGKKWENCPPSHNLYNFVAFLQGPVSKEEIFEQVKHAGLLVNPNRPLAERSEKMNRIYDYWSQQL